MIKANRLILSGGIIYDSVEIYGYNEAGGHYIPGLFEKYQLYLKTKHVKATISMNMISMIRVKRARPQNYMHKVKRVIVTYDQTSFGPAWIIPEHKYKELDVPFIFGYDYKNIEHCAFIADGWLYLTKDELIISIEH